MVRALQVVPRSDLRPTRPGAFTIIELLVVLTIIALLVALLLPALTMARETAQQAGCASGVKQFTLALVVYTEDDRQTVPAHYADNIMWDGNSFNALPYMVNRRYLTPNVLICPSAPANYAYKYWNACNILQKTTYPFNGFWTQTGVYNTPCGTYYYTGGANDENADTVTQTYRVWNTTKGLNSVPTDRTPQFQMKVNHIRQPEKYAVLWDQDVRRNYSNSLADVRSRTSHQRIPGRTFGFFDGHAVWYADSHPLVANCTLTNYFKGTEHITPFINGYIMYYAPSESQHGTNANLAGSPNPRPNALNRNILYLPGG